MLIAAALAFSVPSLDLHFKPHGMIQSQAPPRILELKLDRSSPGVLAGAIVLANRTFRLEFQDENGVPKPLRIDANADGQINRQPIEWEAQTKDGWTRYVANVGLE